ncbi:DnaA N-terminal domain-containing protein [Melittangium boletus]|uniref:DnaA N-terminal domain-containing protein n=1 Tax=Melittangium boletus TaxID=83453 RepID=UPI003DA6A10D
MAGLDWVQVDVGFPMSLEAVCAARTLGMDRRAFLGSIVELQIWAVQALPSGRFERFGLSRGQAPDASADASADEAVWCEALESAVRWTGAPGAFWDALLRARILVREEDAVRLTLCDRYVQVLEKRRKEAERKRKERAAKSVGASDGRPADGAGTSGARKKKERESEKKTSSAAAAGTGLGSSRLQPVPLTPVEAEEPRTDAEPIQRCLPGMHMVPASPPPEERLQAVVTAGAAEAFFTACQDERCRTLPGLPAEEQPRTWEGWYRFALEKVGGDERRLQAAWRGYIHSDWGRTREPRCTALAFCSPKVWSRYLEPVAEPSAPSTEDTASESTEAGRRWKACLGWLKDSGKRYALTWLAQARAVDVEDGVLVLAVPDAYFRQWVEENYGELVRAVVRDVGLDGVRWCLATEALATGA